MSDTNDSQKIIDCPHCGKAISATSEKISKDEYDRELTISAIVASVIPILFVFGMIVTWIVFGY